MGRGLAPLCNRKQDCSEIQDSRQSLKTMAAGNGVCTRATRVASLPRAIKTNPQGVVIMKRFAASLLCLILLLTAVVFETYGQDRRRRSRFGRKARTVAIIGGGTAIGALVGGKKGAAIGAGGAGLYAFNRGAARRHFKGRTRTAGTVLSGTALGAGVGAAAGGKRAAAIGAGAGAAGSYLYTRRKHYRRRY